MAPKYRGDEEDWLDHPGRGGSQTSAGVRPKKAPAARELMLPQSAANATVSEVFPMQCRVRLDDGGAELLCSYRRAKVVSKSKTDARERTPVAVGDRVRVEQKASSGAVISGVCMRKNQLSRPAPGREHGRVHHVLAANVDLLVVVASVRQPEFSPGLIDRFLVAAQAESISVCIALTKADLMTPGDQPWEIYLDLGVHVFPLSVKVHQGVDAFCEFLGSKRVVFCGPSGVGKTSLLRELLGQDVGQVGSVNAATGKGRHTTTGAVLFEGPHSAQWIDTPGVKEFGLIGIEAQDLAAFFPEFQALSCETLGCRHVQESGCQARGLPRYSSYLKIYQSLITD
ncbi:MAG: ribosome small subunit-dependent GTPase A [Bdellovibrionia bacterium]